MPKTKGNMGNGWIKIHRKILEWEWYDDANTFKLFMHLMLTANHAPKNWRGQVIERGQKLTSRAKLSAETKLSEQQIRTCLERLKSTNEITIQATKRQTVITLCNYDTYQSTADDVNQPINQQNVTISTNNQPTINQATNKNDKNVRKKDITSTAESIYQFFPRKVGKGAAVKAIEKALKIVDAETLKSAVKEYSIAAAQWPESEKHFIKHPATWFNQQCWEDDRETWKRQNTQTNGTGYGSGTSKVNRNHGTRNEGKGHLYAGATGGRDSRGMLPGI